MASKVVYKHEEILHNMQSPEVVVPELIRLFHPKSVIDFGCGIGNFLEVFLRNGVEEICGLDGPWVDPKMLSKHIDSKYFQAVDFTQPIKIDKRYDLAISFEVAEHLPLESADLFVKSIVQSSDIIVFSAAFPFQGGQNHLNEQWPEYWAEKFTRYDYERHDLIRPLLWESSNVQLWYRQNTFVYARKGTSLPRTSEFTDNFRAAHPEMYLEKARELDYVMRGKGTLTLYSKLLLKFALRKLGLRK